MKGYRTFVFNIIVALVALVRVAYPEYIAPSDMEINEFLDQLDMAIMVVLWVGNLGLRFITNTPIFKK
jgi:hypothetical protein